MTTNANAYAERWVRSARAECLDHLLILGEARLRYVLTAYVAYYNRARPHQGRCQRVPAPSGLPPLGRHHAGDIIASPVLGGLHHPYRRAA